MRPEKNEIERVDEIVAMANVRASTTMFAMRVILDALGMFLRGERDIAYLNQQTIVRQLPPTPTDYTTFTGPIGRHNIPTTPGQRYQSVTHPSAYTYSEY